MLMPNALHNTIRVFGLLCCLFVPSLASAALQMHLTLDSTLNDASSNGNNASFAGGSANPNYATAVKNQGLNFDGNNDYIRAGSLAPGSTFSVAFWMRADNLDSIDTWMEYVRTNRRNDFFIGYDASLSQLFVELGDNNTSEDEACGDPKFCTGLSLVANRWYHITAVVTPTTLTLYLDGEQAYTTTHSTSVSFSPGTWLIGGDSDSNPADTADSDFFDGRLDDIRIYNHALSQTEISAIIDLLAFWKFDQCSWSNPAEVLDSSGNTHHGTAVNGVVPDTGYLCNAGSFDGSNDYISLSGFPNLTGDFTISAWIQPNEVSDDHRIFADDENNSGGFAFSLGDNANGQLRLFSRTVNPVSLDTPSVISAGNWYHVVAVHNATARTRQIFVNGSAVTGAQSYTGNWGSDGGTASIGGETDGAGSEAVANWRFNGLIDEMRIYQRPLTSEEIGDYYTTPSPFTRTCPTCTPTPSQNLILSTDNNETLGGLSFSDGSLAEYDAATDTATLYFNENNFSGSENIDAVHVLGNGIIILSVSGNATLGGLSFGDGDLAAYDPSSDSATLYFDENMFSGNEDIDAVYVRANGNILLSTDGNATLGGLSFSEGDIVEYNPSTNTATLFFDENNFSGNENIDGFHLLDNGNLLISISGSGTLGGLSFSDGDIVEYNPSSNTASLYFDESNFSGGADIDAVSIPTATITLDHIRIEHDGNALTCEPETITVRACASADCTSLYTGDVSVTLSPTGWIGGDTQVISGGSGTLQLRNTTAQTITLGVTGSAPAAANAVVCLNTATSANTCSLTFHDSGFTYAIPTQTSCATSGAITISAVRLDDTSQACVPTFISQTRNVTFSLNYSDPASGTETLNLNYNSSDYTVTTPGVTVPIAFDGSGQATFTVAYADAGQITLNSQYTGSLATDDAGLTMLGSAAFLTKPARLYVYSDDANSDCASADVTCSAFVSAGDSFNLKVRGACNDASNTLTPNFILAGLTLTHDNIAPNLAEGNLGVTAFDISDADNGEHTIGNQTVSEVGAFTFTASLPAGGYFGESIGDSTLNTSSYIGRFYPHHFCLGNTQLANRVDADTAGSCTDSFSYLDEDMRIQFDLRAQAMGSACSSADVTQNYDATWSRFFNPFVDDTTAANEGGKWNLGAVNDPLGTPASLNARITLDTAGSSPATGSFSNGTVSVSAILSIRRQGSAPTFTAEPPLSDVHLGINPVDLDGVQLTSTTLLIDGSTYADIGNTTLYFGRLFAENAYGTNDSATPLDMFARTEYCTAVSGGTCTSWQHNTSDSCTLYNIAPPGGTTLGGYYERASAAVPSAAFNFNDTGTAPDYARVHVPDTLNHSAGWRLFYNGGGDGGDFVIPFRFPFNTDPSVHPYLLHLDGIASFGQFRGDDRIIFWREVLE